MENPLRKIGCVIVALPLVALAIEPVDSIIGQNIYDYRHIQESRPIVFKDVQVKRGAILKVTTPSSVTLVPGFTVERGSVFELASPTDTVNFIRYAHKRSGHRYIRLGITDTQF